MDKAKTEILVESIIEHLKTTVSDDLFNHCLRTSDYALKLNREHSLGLDESQVEIAALLHDMAKEYEVSRYLEIAVSNGYIFDDLAKNNSKLMHGIIGAFEAKTCFGIDDEEIQSAIAKHTVGCAEMNDLDLLIFAADKIEPGRDYPDADNLRVNIQKDFIKGCLEIFESNKMAVLKKDVKYHPDGDRAIEALKKRIDNPDFEIEQSDVEEESSDNGNDVINAGEKKTFIRSLIAIDSYIIVCAILAIFITFLGSTIYGLYVFYTGIEVDMSAELLAGKHPPSYYFNGREELLFLIAGLDEVEHRSRTDTLILAKIDFKRQKIKCISIPRDTYVQVPGSVANYWGRINSAYTRGGEERLLEAIQLLVGHYPDYLVLLDYNGFIDIVDMVGGVEIDVDKNMNYDDEAGDLHIHIDKGVQLLNGEDALGYVRYRQDVDGDFSRIRRQQNFFKAFQNRLLSVKNTFKANKIISTMSNSFDITVIESEKEELNITNKKFQVNQYVTIEKVIKNIPQDNISFETIPILKEGVVDGKWVLIPNYIQFDVLMTDFFSP